MFNTNTKQLNILTLSFFILVVIVMEFYGHYKESPWLLYLNL